MTATIAGLWRSRTLCDAPRVLERNSLTVWLHWSLAVDPYDSSSRRLERTLRGGDVTSRKLTLQHRIKVSVFATNF
eukprot:m.13331 g.13331  ORF g.13331 m.13331 type:complete len:76 (-) comp7240_c0_seq1:124-351(-)